jgi:hypothetical protein
LSCAAVLVRLGCPSEARRAKGSQGAVDPSACGLQDGRLPGREGGGWRRGARGLSARALRARPTAHLLARTRRSAAHPMLPAALLLCAAAAGEMRRGGSRREPALSPRAPRPPSRPTVLGPPGGWLCAHLGKGHLRRRRAMKTRRQVAFRWRRACVIIAGWRLWVRGLRRRPAPLGGSSHCFVNGSRAGAGSQMAEGRNDGSVAGRWGERGNTACERVRAG